MLPRKSGRTPGPISGKRVGVLAIAAVSGILMTPNQAPANADIGQTRTLGSISQLNAAGAPEGHFSLRPDPSRRQARGHEIRPSDRGRGRSHRYQERPYDRQERFSDRYRGRRGGNDFARNAGPQRERLSRSERLMQELQNDPSFPEIIIREK